jgi:hypothetical protein
VPARFNEAIYVTPYITVSRKTRKKDSFKSDGERKLADFFESYGISYIYERGVFIRDDGKTKIWYPDFYLPEYAVYVEYYGLVGDPDYDEGIKKKTDIYSSMGIDVIPIFPWNFNEDWKSFILNSLLSISKNRLSSVVQKIYLGIRQ